MYIELGIPNITYYLEKISKIKASKKTIFK
jgi:hypothetical protein